MIDRVVLEASVLLGPSELFQPVLAAAALQARTAVDPGTGALFVLRRGDVEPLLRFPTSGYLRRPQPVPTVHA